MFECMFFFFKQKTAYEMRISDWSSDVCSSDLLSLVLQRVGPTLLLMGTGLLVAIVLGIAAGVFSAVRRNSAADIALSVTAFVGISSPAFLTALVGLYVFAVLLRWAPPGGMLPPGAPFSVSDLLRHLALPALLLPFGPTAPH